MFAVLASVFSKVVAVVVQWAPVIARYAPIAVALLRKWLEWRSGEIFKTKCATAHAAKRTVDA